MKKLELLLIFFLLTSRILFPGNTKDPIVLKNGQDYLETLIDNGIYCKLIQDIEYDSGSLYLLDSQLCLVFVVDLKTGKLIRTLFRRGQGPNELMMPMSIKVRNSKVFVLDQGFNGIKICDIEGKPVKEFKTSGMIGRRNIDVNDKNEIFAAEYNSQNNTYVTVYTWQGEKKHSLVKIGSGNKLDLQRSSYKVLIDSEGNILLLFPVLRELKKFSPNGEMLWETRIKNKLLDKKDADEDGVKVTDKGAIHTKISVFDFIITKSNNIIIGHAYGGCIIDKNGNFTNLITFEPIGALFLFKIAGDKIINGFGPRILNLYDIDIKIKEVFK